MLSFVIGFHILRDHVSSFSDHLCVFLFLGPSFFICLSVKKEKKKENLTKRRLPLFLLKFRSSHTVQLMQNKPSWCTTLISRCVCLKETSVGDCYWTFGDYMSVILTTHSETCHIELDLSDQTDSDSDFELVNFVSLAMYLTRTNIPTLEFSKHRRAMPLWD
jgi:hypothetical protein